MAAESPSPLDAAYRERASLVAHLARTYDAHWAVDPAEPAWPVICIHTPAGQMAWHVGQGDVGLFPADVPTRPTDWDGHTTDEKYARLARLGTPTARIKTVRRLDVEPGDALVIRLSHEVDDLTGHEALLREAFGDTVRILFLGPGAEMSVLHPVP